MLLKEGCQLGRRTVISESRGVFLLVLGGGEQPVRIGGGRVSDSDIQ